MIKDKDKYKENATINGRKRNIYRGPKGGKYYMKGGRKRYVNRIMKGGDRYYIEDNNKVKQEIKTAADFLRYTKLLDYGIGTFTLANISELREATDLKQLILERKFDELYKRIFEICGITINNEIAARRFVRAAKRVIIEANESSSPASKPPLRE